MTKAKILFSRKDEWADIVRRNAKIAGYDAVFAHLDKANLSAFDAIVPFHLECQETLRDLVTAGNAIAALFPSRRVEALCDDKLIFNQTAVRLGFDHCIPKVLDKAPVAATAYPVIFKPRRDLWGRGSRLAFNQAEAEIMCLQDPEGFLQEYIQGSEEYATHILLADGKIVYSSTIRYSRDGVPYVQGKHNPPPRGKWLPEIPAMGLFANLLSRIGFGNGTCCIDFRLVDGIPQIFEINPRFGGSLMQRIGEYLDAYTEAAADWRKAA